MITTAYPTVPAELDAPALPDLPLSELSPYGEQPFDEYLESQAQRLREYRWSVARSYHETGRLPDARRERAWLSSVYAAWRRLE